MSLSATTTSQFVVFHLAGEEYALPVAQVREVIRYSAPRPITADDAFTIGVISLRGRLLPVGDLALQLGLASTHTDESKILVVETDGGSAGVIVDDVDDVVSVSLDSIEAA